MRLVGAAAVVAGALFYPARCSSSGAALALWLLCCRDATAAQAQDWSLARRFAFLACALRCCRLLVLPTALSAQSLRPSAHTGGYACVPRDGGQVCAEDRAPAEYFFPTFATAFRSGVVGFGPPFIAAWSVRARPNESRVLWSLAAVIALGLALLCVRSGAARRLLCLLVAACAAFVAAKAFSPYLYLPTAPPSLRRAAPGGRAGAGVCVRIRRTASRKSGAVCGTGARTCGLHCRVAGARRAPSRRETGLYIELPANERVYGFLATLPRSALIAGLPDALMDNVPYVSRRQVLVTYETHQAFHTRYVQEMRRRVRAVVAATFAADYAPIASLRDKFHVTHLVVNRAHYGTAPPRYFAQFGASCARHTRAAPDHSCIIAKGVPAAEVFQQGTIVVLDLSKLAAARERRLCPRTNACSEISTAKRAELCRRRCVRAQALVEFEERTQHVVGRFDLRIVADALEQHDVGIRHELAVARGHVRAGDRVDGAVDHTQRHARRLQRADPALAEAPPLFDVADEEVADAVVRRRDGSGARNRRARPHSAA
jgi:hypothetical protein